MTLSARPHRVTVATAENDRREQSWVALVRSGDERAFAATFQAYYVALGEFVGGYVHSPQAAEDIVQEVFVRIWEHRATWEVRESIRSYLFGAARNAALNALKHQRVVERYADGWTPGPDTDRDRPLPPGLGQSDTRADARLDAGELHRAVHAVLATLPARTRDAYVLRVRHELSYVEVAAAMGVSVKRVEFLLSSAYRELRRVLGDDARG